MDYAKQALATQQYCMICKQIDVAAECPLRADPLQPVQGLGILAEVVKSE